MGKAGSYIKLTFHVIENGVPAGTISLRPGAEMGFPLGVAPTGVVYAEVRPANAAEISAAREKRMLL